MLQSVREVLLSIHTKFELSTCLVYPTIEINMCSLLVKKVLQTPPPPPYIHTKQYLEDSRRNYGSLENRKMQFNGFQDGSLQGIALCVCMEEEYRLFNS